MAELMLDYSVLLHLLFSDHLINFHLPDAFGSGRLNHGTSEGTRHCDTILAFLFEGS
jgi:hypothetical protein